MDHLHDQTYTTIHHWRLKVLVLLHHELFKQCRDMHEKTYFKCQETSCWKKGKMTYIHTFKASERTTWRSVFRSTLNWQKASGQCFQLYFISVCWTVGVGQFETQAIVSMWSEIVSWPSIQPEFHASPSLSAIYSTVAPKKLGIGGRHNSVDSFHLCSEGCLFTW